MALSRSFSYPSAMGHSKTFKPYPPNPFSNPDPICKLTALSHLTTSGTQAPAGDAGEVAVIVEHVFYLVSDFERYTFKICSKTKS